MARPVAARGARPGATRARYACVWIPRFAAAALVRRDPELRGRPIAVLTGPAATRTVLEATAAAAAGGVRAGMPASEAGTRVPALLCRDRDLEAERAAAGALLDAALATSPRVEVLHPDGVALDLAGLGGVGGPEPRIGQRLVDTLEAVGLPGHVGIAGSRTAAVLAARAAAGVTVVEPGRRAAFLAPLPVGLLDPSPDLAERLERWGIRTLGELQALPRAALATRLGPRGARLQALARGEDDRPFIAFVPPESWVEGVTLDWEVATLDGLVFVLHRLLERLCARLAVRDRGATALLVRVGLADGGLHRHTLPLVAPLREPRTLLHLLRAELERLTLPAPIVALAVEAETAPLHPGQADLFEARRPTPRELGETLGRLVALVGHARVGAPILGDTHRPDAIGLTGFDHQGGSPNHSPPGPPHLGVDDPGFAAPVCRRFVPPRPARVVTEGGRPRRVEAAGVGGPVVACAGPWRTAGEWWADTAWAREEWDVALPDGAVYRLGRDTATGAWTLDAVYD